MPYRAKLTPWIIVRLLPDMKNIIVGRFRNKSNADGHLKVLQNLIPSARFTVIFDPPPVQRRSRSCKAASTSSSLVKA